MRVCSSRVCFSWLRVTLVVEIDPDLICCCFLRMLFNTFVNGKSFVVIIVWTEFVLKKAEKKQDYSIDINLTKSDTQ